MRKYGKLSLFFSAFALWALFAVLSGCGSPDPNEKLFKAIHEDNPDAVEQALKRGADPNRLSSELKKHRFDAMYATSSFDGAASFSTEEGVSPLILACHKGQGEIVELLLEYGAEVDAVNPNGGTALMFALNSQHDDIARRVLEHGANAQIRTPAGNPILQSAVLWGSPQGASLLLEFGADPNSADRSGTPLLMKAIRQGNAEGVKTLLKHGANPDSADIDGNPALLVAMTQTFMDREIFDALIRHGAQIDIETEDSPPPLFVAVREGFVEVVEAILDAGAEVNRKNRRGDTPLSVATEERHSALVALLLERGADVNATDRYQRTALDIAAKLSQNPEISKILQQAGGKKSIRFALAEQLVQASKTGDLQAVRTLVSKGVDVNALILKNGQERNALLTAVQSRKPEIVRFLLDQGADAQTIDEFMDTPVLLWAAELNKPDIITLLLRYGADIHATDTLGKDALMAAARYDALDAVRVLLEAGADIHVRSESDTAFSVGWTALCHAAEQGSPELLELLLKHGADIYPRTLFLAASRDTPAHLKLLLDRADGIAGMTDSAGESALMHAARRGRLANVKLLLEHGAEVNGQDHEGNTALHEAAFFGHVEVVRTLLGHGAALDVRERESGETPLMDASAMGHAEVAQLLLEGGADPNIACSKTAERLAGWTALHRASVDGHSELVRILLEYGAESRTLIPEMELEYAHSGNSTYVVTLENAPPLVVASAGGDLDIVRLLLDNGADANAAAAEKWGALHSAAWFDRPEVLQYLLESGAHANADSSLILNNATPLILAAVNGHREIARVLLRHHADPALKAGEGPYQGKTALDIAKERGHTDLTLVLKGAVRK